MPEEIRMDQIDARLEYEEKTRQVTDIELERIASEEGDYESAPPVYEINTYPADFTLEVLYKKWEAGDIEIPKFQRQFVWKEVQASKLIESFLIGLPVPAVFLYTERKTNRFLVIDGQQRLRSVFYFFDGFFGQEQKGKRQIFQLTGLNEESKYFAKTFEDLDDSDKRKLNNSVLRSFIVQQLDPDDDTSIYHIFERLNTGGTLLANQEIRNCVYRGRFNELLHELNRFSLWRAIIGREQADSRQRDVELLLRFFALRDIDEYAKPMKDYLSKFMKKKKNPPEEVIINYKDIFYITCDKVIKSLGNKPFHIRAGLNSAVYDCVMVSFAAHIDKIPSDIKNRYQKLIQLENFLKTVSGGTTDTDVVLKRFAIADEILFG